MARNRVVSHKVMYLTLTVTSTVDMLRYILELFTPRLVLLKRGKAIWHLILCESYVVIILYSYLSFLRLKTCGEEFS